MSVWGKVIGGVAGFATHRRGAQARLRQGGRLRRRRHPARQVHGSRQVPVRASGRLWQIDRCAMSAIYVEVMHLIIGRATWMLQVRRRSDDSVWGTAAYMVKGFRPNELLRGLDARGALEIASYHAPRARSDIETRSQNVLARQPNFARISLDKSLREDFRDDKKT